MASYKELLAQQEKLQKQVQEAREKEVGTALEKIMALVNEYEIDASLVFPDAIKHAKEVGYEEGMVEGQNSMRRGPVSHPQNMQGAQQRTPARIKYRHPVSGETWTGRGIQPRWLSSEVAQGKKVDDFLVPM